MALLGGFVFLTVTGCAVGLVLDGLHPGFDLAVSRSVADLRGQVLTGAARAVSAIGSLPTLAVIAALTAGRSAYHREIRPVLVIALTLVGSVALANLIKFAVDRPRPPLMRLVEVSSHSFPSQHACQAAAVLPLLVLVLFPVGRARRVALPGAAALAIAVGLSRIYLGVHYFTDVMAGFALGLGWVWIVVQSAGTALPRRRTNLTSGCG